MKRTIKSMLALAMLVGFVSVSTGCSSKGGPYFQKTRQNKAHVQKDRIYNPADYRYVTADEE